MEKAINSTLTSFQVNGVDPPAQKQMNFAIAAEINRLDNLDGTIEVTEFVEDFFRSWITRKSAKKKDTNYYRRWNVTVQHALEIRPNLRFLDIDENFFRDYVSWIIDEHGNTNNTIAGKVKRMKQLCREAGKYGYKTNPHFEDFTAKEERMPAIYLQWSEVEALEKLKDLTEQERYVRDRFIFRCYTGIRSSDMHYLNASMISQNRGKRVLRMEVVKTVKSNSIFLPDKAFQIWENWGFAINQHTTWNHLQVENEVIKKLARRAKLNREVQILRHQGDKALLEISQIWEVISSHTARRTYARAWYDRGGNLNWLREHLGHTDLATTMRYIGIERDEANQEAARLFG